VVSTEEGSSLLPKGTALCLVFFAAMGKVTVNAADIAT
jgi:hypothetical protein